jgi:phage terminase large subunit
MLDIPKVIFDQQEQRTREFWLADWNPKCTDHYCFNLEKRPDVKFLRTTFKDNPFISIIEKNKILSYEPTPENKAIGTADEYRWKVYGLGERASRTGLVHPNITWISEFPADCEKVGYGMDFGFTNSPSTVVKVGRKGNNLYLQKMFYAPIKDVTQLFEPLRIILNGHYITADCADKYLGSAGFIRDLRGAGFQVIACRKFQGSVKWGIDLINRHKVHIVYDVDFRREAENRVWKEIGGVPLNEPESGNDHLFDAVAYCMQTDFKD